MRVLAQLRRGVARIVRSVSPDAAADIHERRIAPQTLRDARAQSETLEHRITDLEGTVSRLDADLMESRRLNLRAAELLDIVQTEIVRGATSAGHDTAHRSR